RISGANQRARSKRRLLKIGRLGREDLPVRDGSPQKLYRAHVRKLSSEALVMLGCRCEPDSVVFGAIVMVPEKKYDLVIDVDGQTSEHPSGNRMHRCDRFEHEF